eukprot:superscaffoldBa00000861_g7669
MQTTRGLARQSDSTAPRCKQEPATRGYKAKFICHHYDNNSRTDPEHMTEAHSHGQKRFQDML